jgi:hypothetical protein
MKGLKPKLDPAIVIFGCADSGGIPEMYDIKWSSWTANGATGTGKLIACFPVNGPTCASAGTDLRTYPNTVLELSDPVKTTIDGTEYTIFSNFVATPPGPKGSGPVETDGNGLTGWGWAPQPAPTG